MNCVHLIGHLTGPIQEMNGTGPDGNPAPATSFGITVSARSNDHDTFTVLADGQANAVAEIAKPGDLVVITGRLEIIETRDGPEIVVRLDELGALR